MAKNKPHKQRHASKHAIAEREQGRKVQVSVKRTVVNSSKEKSRQQAIDLRSKKMNAVLEAKRIGTVGAPRIVGVCCANESARSAELVQLMEKRITGTYSSGMQPKTVVTASRQRLTLLTEADGNEQAIVDVAKVSDIVVLAIDCSEVVQQTITELQGERANGEGEEGEFNDGASFASGTTWFSDIGLCITDLTRDIVSSLNAQGLPTVIVAVQGLETFKNPKKARKTLQVHERYFVSVFGDSVKVLPVSEEQDIDSLIRNLCVVKIRELKWRTQRPYFVVDQGSYDAESRKLTISGYLRGNNLSATQLIHLTDHGTFQIESVAEFGDPHATSKNRKDLRGILETSTEETRESLVCIQASDTVEDEGLPTEADVAFEQQRALVKKIRVPEGVSEYQAAWYEFEEGNSDFVEERPQEDDNFINFDAMSKRTTQTEVDFLKASDVIRHERMTDEERLEEMTKLKDMSEEEMWNPDMVDTPVNLPARQRFAKYRGMKSFNTGKWDTNENLPIQYGHVFKLQGFSRIRDVALAKCAAGPAEEGTYVTVTLLEVPANVWNPEASLLIASGQFEHEQKYSVLHFQVQRSTELDVPIKSKTAMLAHIGFRKFYVAPVFSDVSVGDRTKFARFFHEEEKFRRASFYGPISYNPCPLLLFQVPSLEEQAEQVPLRLACFGAALPPNPDLLILKRAVLTGRVAMIHKKQIVVKYMFFNEDDVKWFQPVDIYTRLGRRGKITKAVGTHGLYKAALNDQVMQHDVICMDLYKRVFPKWTTVPFNINEMVSGGTGEAEDEEYE